MKKEYIRPEAEKINFQTEEVMTEEVITDGFGGTVRYESLNWPPTT